MAGLLGQIFSAGNVAKRQLRDLLGNPVLGAQQFVGNLNDRARNLNEMTSAAAREGMNYGPATQRLAGLMADAYNPMGLTVFHGSPAKFNKFDRTKIGSGEGAQAYGYGHYVAQSPDVAKSYAGAGTTKGGAAFEQKMLRQMEKAQDSGRYGEAGALEELLVNRNPITAKQKFSVENGYSPATVKQAHDAIDRLGDVFMPGNIYKIDLPDEQIAKMINWDKPIKEQSKEIQDIAKSLGLQIDDLGGDIIARMDAKRPEGAEKLRQAGIPGIQYYDAQSRGGQPATTQNFVVFPGNEDLLTILRRNGGLLEPQPKNFETSVTDASEIFGQGAKRIKYTDPNSGGMIDVLQKPDGTASVLGLEVPEQMRGQGIGQSLQSQVMQDFPEMMGQVSSKAAAKTAYRLGRRPPNQPDATLDDVYKIMDEYSSVNLVSPDMQKRFLQSLLD
jgi:ribosomal protein S18 acetylase RimI-like enzyme